MSQPLSQHPTSEPDLVELPGQRTKAPPQPELVEELNPPLPRRLEAFKELFCCQKCKKLLVVGSTCCRCAFLFCYDCVPIDDEAKEQEPCPECGMSRFDPFSEDLKEELARIRAESLAKFKTASDLLKEQDRLEAKRNAETNGQIVVDEMKQLQTDQSALEVSEDETQNECPQKVSGKTITLGFCSDCGSELDREDRACSHTAKHCFLEQNSAAYLVLWRKKQQIERMSSALLVKVLEMEYYFNIRCKICEKNVCEVSSKICANCCANFCLVCARKAAKQCRDCDRLICSECIEITDLCNFCS